MTIHQPRYKIIKDTDVKLSNGLELQIQSLSRDGWRVHTIDLRHSQALMEKWVAVPTDKE